jgi:hypothetical protein
VVAHLRRATDEVVLPGGRIDALATGRLLRPAITNGATVIVVADPGAAPVASSARSATSGS